MTMILLFAARRRWRRYRDTRQAYDFTHLPFRQWMELGWGAPERNAYAAPPGGDRYG